MRTFNLMQWIVLIFVSGATSGGFAWAVDDTGSGRDGREVKVIPARFSTQSTNFGKTTKERKPPTESERHFRFLKSGEKTPASQCIQDPAQCRCPDGLQKVELTDGFPQPVRGTKPPYELKLSKGMGGQRTVSCVTPCPQGKFPRIKYDAQGKASFQCES